MGGRETGDGVWGGPGDGGRTWEGGGRGEKILGSASTASAVTRRIQCIKQVSRVHCARKNSLEERAPVTTITVVSQSEIMSPCTTDTHTETHTHTEGEKEIKHAKMNLQIDAKLS